MPLRLLIAALAASAIVVVGGLVATAAPSALTPTASAAQAEYCPPGELKRRLRAYKSYTKQMARQRARYFQQTKNRRLRAIFVRKQKAQQRALLKAVRRCN